MFGIDEIYEEILMEAKSPEEIKKILQYQFVEGKGVPQDVFELILEDDPTKKKSFTKWVLMQWETEKDAILKALKYDRIKDMFSYYQERANTGLNLLGMKSFSEAMKNVPANEIDPIFDGETDENLPENDFEIVYDSPEWKIAVPHTVEANIKLGRGCRWCTAGAYGKPRYWWEQYSPYGTIWVNYDKRKSEICPIDNIEYPYTRYQFLFEFKGRPELRDSENKNIVFESMDIPEDVMEFYGNQEEWYVAALESSGENRDREENINRRRLEQCICRKHVEGIEDIVVIPGSDDDEYYNVYSISDLEDPISDYEYYSDSIYDVCENFPMLILKSENNVYGDDELHIFYVQKSSYHNNRYYWYSCDDVILHGGNDYMKYFIERNDEIHAFFGNSVNDVKIMEYNYPINSVKEVNFENAPEEYKNGCWILIHSNKGHYSLLYINPNTKEVEIIVKKDMPLDKEGNFEIIEENGVYFIKGRFKNHPLKYDENYDKELTFTFDRYLNNYNNLAIIESPDDEYGNLKSYGLYDLDKKEVIIKPTAEDIDELGDVLILRYHNYSIAYYCEERRICSQKMGRCTIFGSISNLIKYVSIETNKWRILTIFDGTDHGDFDDIDIALGYDKVLAKIDGEKVVYDVNKSKVILKGFDSLYDLSNSLYVVHNEGKKYIFDAYRNENIDEIHPESNPKCINSVNYDSERLFAYEKINGKFNVINQLAGKILQTDVDEIIPIPHCPKPVFGFILNKRFYFQYGKNIVLPSNHGLPADQVGPNIGGGEREGEFIVGMVIKINGKPIRVIYSLSKRIINNITPLNSTKLTEEDKQEIEKMFSPQKAQISEQFKNIINRMNDL